jgi:hydroxyacylglutathione hydrolase
MRLFDHSTEELTLLQYHVGGDRNWQYLLADPSEPAAAWMVDPGHAAAAAADLARRRGLRIATILITHGHGDHCGAAAELAELTGAEVWAGRADLLPGARPLADGQDLLLGKLTVRALFTPGHAPDHFVFRCGDALISGDLLFCGKVGGTGEYFPGSSAAEEWQSLQRLMALPDDVRVFPGHDYYGGPGEMVSTTIGHERRHNPFLLCKSLEAFEALKADWPRYKKEYGIR